MLNYLVIPEIEVERIFNNLRYKYLNCIYLADFESPQERIKADYNKAFQTLAGIKIYQGNTKDRKDNDFFFFGKVLDLRIAQELFIFLNVKS